MRGSPFALTDAIAASLPSTSAHGPAPGITFDRCVRVAECATCVLIEARRFVRACVVVKTLSESFQACVDYQV